MNLLPNTPHTSHSFHTPDTLLFDLDGTLSDPLVGIAHSINYALEHFGHATLGLDALKAYIGPPLDESFMEITGITTATDIARYVAKYRECYAATGYAENILYPEISEVLRELHKAGIPLAVCTSKRIDFAESILALFGLRELFQFVNGGEIGTHKWMQISRLLDNGTISARSMMIGDRAVDIQAAHRNGLSAVGVLWGYGSQQELENEHPEYFFTAVDELLSLIPIMTATSQSDFCP